MKHMQKPDYLTDEELMDLIASVEIGAKLSAPDYLKESILKKAVPKNRKKQHELLFFSAKITAAAAAALSRTGLAARIYTSGRGRKRPQGGLIPPETKPKGKQLLRHVGRRRKFYF